MLRKFPKSRLICRIDMSGFLAIMFALVFMFLPAPPIDGGRISVDLPKAARPTPQRRANREDALDVAVTRDGSIWFNQWRVRPEELRARIRDRLIQGSEPKIYIRADARARYGAVVEVLNTVRESGIVDIAFIAEERPTKSAAR